MGSPLGAVDTVVVVLLSDHATAAGLDWSRACQYMPSIDTPDMRAWLNACENGGGTVAAVVVPVQCWLTALRGVPYRQICVPPGEYALFTAALALMP